MAAQSALPPGISAVRIQIWAGSFAKEAMNHVAGGNEPVHI